MGAKTYAEKLKGPRWQKKRLEILDRDNFTCVCCTDKETELHVHHKKYEKSGDPWETKNEDLITLCKDCHHEVESVLKVVDYSTLKAIKSKPKVGSNDFPKILFLRLPVGVSLTMIEEKEYIFMCTLSHDLVENVFKLSKIE